MIRLHAIADLVAVHHSGAIADIGYDHGHLLAILADRYVDRRLLGVELQASSAALFAELHPELTERVVLRQGSGLTPIAPGDDVETVVIAGMGEHRMIAILEQALPPVLAGVRRLVLCPADFRNLLRPWLHRSGWTPIADRVVEDRDRLYEVMAYERGAEPPAEGAMADYFGSLGEPALSTYCRQLLERHRGALAAPPSAQSPLLDKLRAAKRYLG